MRSMCMKPCDAVSRYSLQNRTGLRMKWANYDCFGVSYFTTVGSDHKCSKQNSGTIGFDGCAWPTFRISWMENDWPPIVEWSRANGDWIWERLTKYLIESFNLFTRSRHLHCFPFQFSLSTEYSFYTKAIQLPANQECFTKKKNGNTYFGVDDIEFCSTWGLFEKLLDRKLNGLCVIFGPATLILKAADVLCFRMAAFFSEIFCDTLNGPNG